MKKLKTWVVPALYVVSVGIICLSVVAIGRIMATDYEKAIGNNLLPNKIFTDETPTEPVVEVTNEMIVKPYKLESVKITKNYYDSKSDEERQLNSLIFYKNTYMENTGVLYTADETYDVVSVLDGTVTSITEDEILGKVVEVTHSNNLITIYHCLSEVTPKVGDIIHQNDVIGKSGNVNIDSGYTNALLFEVNYQGKIIDPNEFYEMKVSDIIG